MRKKILFPDNLLPIVVSMVKFPIIYHNDKNNCYSWFDIDETQFEI